MSTKKSKQQQLPLPVKVLSPAEEHGQEDPPPAIPKEDPNPDLLSMFKSFLTVQEKERQESEARQQRFFEDIRNDRENLLVHMQKHQALHQSELENNLESTIGKLQSQLDTLASRVDGLLHQDTVQLFPRQSPVEHLFASPIHRADSHLISPDPAKQAKDQAGNGAPTPLDPRLGATSTAPKGDRTAAAADLNPPVLSGVSSLPHGMRFERVVLPRCDDDSGNLPNSEMSRVWLDAVQIQFQKFNRQFHHLSAEERTELAVSYFDDSQCFHPTVYRLLTKTISVANKLPVSAISIFTIYKYVQTTWYCPRDEAHEVDMAKLLEEFVKSNGYLKLQADVAIADTFELYIESILRFIAKSLSINYLSEALLEERMLTWFKENRKAATVFLKKFYMVIDEPKVLSAWIRDLTKGEQGSPNVAEFLQEIKQRVYNRQSDLRLTLPDFQASSETQSKKKASASVEFQLPPTVIPPTSALPSSSTSATTASESKTSSSSIQAFNESSRGRSRYRYQEDSKRSGSRSVTPYRSGSRGSSRGSQGYSRDYSSSRDQRHRSSSRDRHRSSREADRHSSRRRSSSRDRKDQGPTCGHRYYSKDCSECRRSRPRSGSRDRHRSSSRDRPARDARSRHRSSSRSSVRSNDGLGSRVDDKRASHHSARSHSPPHRSSRQESQ